MTEPTEPLATNSPPATPQPTRRIGWPGVVALIALALSLWQWWDNRQQYSNLQQELARRLSEADTSMKQNSVTVQLAHDTTKETRTSLTTLEGKFAETQNQQVALEAMYQELSRNRDEWSLSEIEQILSIAAQQLQLAGNVQGALAALEAADYRLQRIDKPQLASLRKVIDQDIQKLKALPFVDIVGLSVKLDNLAGGIDVLPLISEGRPSQNDDSPVQPTTGSAWSRWTSGMWKELRQLVRIQHMDQPEAPLLSPSQAYFLRENLRLRLLSARLALLSHDEVPYKADLRAAREWLKRYFDTANRGVRNDDAVLRQLIDSSISIQVPDVSGSLEAVRNYKLTARETTPP